MKGSASRPPALGRRRPPPGGDAAVRRGSRRLQAPAGPGAGVYSHVRYSEMNKADPDANSTFTWGPGRSAQRPGGPLPGSRPRRPGHGQPGAGGRAVGVCCSRAPTSPIGTNPWSGWVLLVGILWIVAMTYIRHRASRFGELPEGAHHRDRHVGAVGHRAGLGLQWEPPRQSDPSFSRLIPPAAPRPSPGRPRRSSTGGNMAVGQRGNQGQEQDPGPGGGRIIGRAAAGHLRDREGVVAFAGSARGDWAVQPGPGAATCCRFSAARSSQRRLRHRPGRCSGWCSAAPPRPPRRRRTRRTARTTLSMATYRARPAPVRQDPPQVNDGRPCPRS